MIVVVRDLFVLLWCNLYWECLTLDLQSAQFLSWDFTLNCKIKEPKLFKESGNVKFGTYMTASFFKELVSLVSSETSKTELGR